MKSNDPVVDYMSYNNKSSMYLFPCTNVEIENIVRDLSNTKSICLDGFSMQVIKSIISNISVPLPKSFNSSLIASIFPDYLKHAKVIPVFKCDDKSIINNYRLISVLPIFSKVFEKLMYNRIFSFVDKFKILCDNQYGFRKQHSTYMALINIIDQISRGIDKGRFTIGIFLDLSKALDTIDHEILLRKLEMYGIRGLALSWFGVSIDNCMSNSVFITCVVPQGSILGPCFFYYI